MIDRKDLIKLENFKKIVDRGNFEVKGEAIVTIASLKQWFDEHLPRLTTYIQLNEALKEKSIKVMSELDDLKPKYERALKEIEGFKKTNSLLREENQKFKPKNKTKTKKKKKTNKKKAKTKLLPDQPFEEL